MYRRYNLAHLILVSVVVLSLAPLVLVTDAQARIAFVSNRDGNLAIFVMDDDGRNPRKLSDNPLAEWAPSWFPDGTRIAFTSDKNNRAGNQQIYVMEVDRGNPQRLFNNDFAEWDPAWSPDGQRIAFVSNREDDGNEEIYVMDADGSNQHNLTNHPDDDTDPAWYDPAFAVAPAGKVLTMWRWLNRLVDEA